METHRLILRVLRVFFQGFRLITAGLKKEIDELEENLSKADDQPLAEAKDIT
jgi:hypothetical protein